MDFGEQPKAVSIAQHSSEPKGVDQVVHVLWHCAVRIGMLTKQRVRPKDSQPGYSFAISISGNDIT